MARSRRPEVEVRTDWHQSEKGCWSLSLGERGCRVRVTQRAPGGVFFRETWIEGRGRNMASLHTTDREEAKQRAEAFYLALSAGDQPPRFSPLTLGGLWERYQREAVAYRELTERTRKQRDSHARLLLSAFGSDKVVEYLTLVGWSSTYRSASVVRDGVMAG